MRSENNGASCARLFVHNVAALLRVVDGRMQGFPRSILNTETVCVFSSAVSGFNDVALSCPVRATVELHSEAVKLIRH